MIRWFNAHPNVHRIVHRLTARSQNQACLVDRLVWRQLMADPTFAAREAQIAALHRKNDR